MSTKGEKGPSRDWLNPVLGFVMTSHAKEKIRQWFKKQERPENIERGKGRLEKELSHLGVKTSDREELARLFKYDSVDDFLFAIGYGGLSTHQIALKLAAQEEPPKTIPVTVPHKTPTSAVKVLGVGDMLSHLASCCHPVPGDSIIGYITRSSGVTIHRQDCYNVTHEDEKERLVHVEWERTNSLYPVRIRVEAWDRVGLMRDITTIVAEEKVNIVTVNSPQNEGTKPDGHFTVELTLETTGLAQLSRLLSIIEGITEVTSVTRLGDEAPKKANSST
jgi:GTP pyrophosphokinase